MRCPLALTRTQVVYGEGPIGARILILGEAPGEDEDRHGRPFVGRSGRTLDRLLEAAGIARDETYITNSVLCRPPEPNPPPANRTPLQVEVDACAAHFDRQLAAVRPVVIVTLGATALRRMAGPGYSVERDHGRAIRLGGPVIVPTFHPAALTRRVGRREAMVEDLRIAVAYVVLYVGR